jgi:PAS domain S-box-containing protein/diguanylate cyclase (GGDEF)-like protein
MDERHETSPEAASPDFRSVFDAADISIQVTDAQGQFLAANRAHQQYLGYDGDTLAGMRVEDVIHPDDRQACTLLHRQLAQEETGAAGSIVSRRLEVRFLRRNGRVAWGTLRLTRSAGSPVIVGAIEDLSERRRLEQQLRYRSQHDDLTGVPNRLGLQERLQRLLYADSELGGMQPGSGTPVSTSADAAASRQFALLLVGIGRLREIGAAFGSRVRDGVIQEVATRLRGALDDGDLVARFDEDSFATILEGAAPGAATRVAGRILAVLHAPFDIEGQSLDIDASVGVAVFPDHGRNGSEPGTRSRTLVRHAEIALETAWRRAGTGGPAPSGVALFDEEQGRLSRRRSDLASHLHRAIRGNELVLHYQPKVDVRTGAVTGVEALVRWAHPGYGLVLPDDFVPLAEESGVIKPLTRWVLDEALQQAHRWRGEGIEIPVVVNLSARILHDHYVVDMAMDALANGTIAPDCLGLEVTESAVMLDPGRALVALRRLHDLGVTISLDDFGTGYSSFAYLDQLPASELKIDRSFVRDMVKNPSHFRIVHGTIDIGHDLGLATVAEGIEDQQTLDALSTLGCDVGQGFFVSPPLPGSQVGDWLRARSA